MIIDKVILDADIGKDFNILESLEAAKIDPREEIKPPEIALKQIDPTADNDRILATLGNFSIITGKAKSRKSFLMIILTAALISGRKIHGIMGHLPPGKANGIFVDTEQSKYHVQLSLRRICRLSEIDYPENLDVIALRKYNPSERLKLLEYAIYNTPDLGFVVIDGIKDLVTSINDEAEATMLISKLLKWTDELNIHIFIVLHQNKSDNNARGHIGTEAVNKAETHLTVLKSDTDKNISIVEPEGCRNREPEPFAFEIDKISGLPIPAENYELRTTSKPCDIDLDDVADYQKYKILTSVFSKQDEYGYAELRIQMKLSFKDQIGKIIGDNKVKDLIVICKNNGWLLQERQRKPYTLGKYNTVDYE